MPLGPIRRQRHQDVRLAGLKRRDELLGAVGRVAPLTALSRDLACFDQKERVTRGSVARLQVLQERFPLARLLGLRPQCRGAREPQLDQAFRSCALRQGLSCVSCS